MTRSGSRSPHQPGTTPSSFLGSRLRTPANPARYCRRPRLLGLLDEGTSAPITLVVAPAGSGKSSLLVDWCGATSLPTSWLSLDETDRDGRQFWAGVAGSLAELVGGLDVTAPSLRGRGSVSGAAAALVAALEGHDGPPAVLVIDDVHLVDQDDEITTSLAQFLGRMPQWLHVVLLSRTTPRLPIDRLRVRGQLAEIRFAELRFSAQEAVDMLVGLSPSLDGHEVAAAVARSGGWAAGLQLTALAARSDRAQPGSSTHVGAQELLFADYVWGEVLTAEREPVVDVLLDTSVVKRTNAALTCALTGRADAAELLLEAEARGLFVTRLGRSGWLEVHAVVRDELLAEAARRSPQRVATMHARAARWFEDNGDVTSALEHWSLAGQPREVLRLLAAQVTLLHDTGREATIAHAIAHVPLNVATADLSSMLEFAWCLLLVDKGRFVETVGQAGALLERMTEPDVVQVARLDVLRSMASTITGDWQTGGELASRAVSLLGEAPTEDPLGRFGWDIIARDIALSERWDDASPQLERARLDLGRDPERRIAYEGTRALGHALAGHPVDALRIAAGVREAATVNSMTILHAELGIAEAIAHRELGDRTRAVTELASLAEDTRGPVTHARVLALLELTQLRLDEGDVGAAEETFERARDVIHSEFPAAGGLSWLARTGTQVALAAGRTAEARAWCEQTEDSFWSTVGIARIELVEGRRSDAELLLDRVQARCLRHEVVRDLLRVRAASTPQEGAERAALAVRRACSSGLVQTVASEGVDVLEPLELNAWISPQAWLDRVRRAASPRAGGLVRDPSLPGEHLTERELEVLRLLPSRLTSREIADQLFISVNTLKFHLRIIYRKLGVASREAAAERVRPRATVRR